MQLFKELIVIDKKVETAIYLQITNAIVHNIRRGRIRRGLKLPGTRELAAVLGIHRQTMVAAFNELEAQGWITTIPRKGTFVVQQLPEIKPVKIQQGEIREKYPEKAGFSIDEKYFNIFPTSDFSTARQLVIDDGFPDIRLAPIELLMRELRSLSKQGAFKKHFNYGSSKGPLHLRETLAAYLSDTRGLPISTDNIMITKGAQMGVYLAASVLIKPGDHVIVGEPGYFAVNLTFEQLGAQLHRVPVDDFGIDVDAIEELCKKKKIRLVYVIPHHHNPTTVTLTPERRLRLLELAATYKFAIIEDDYDYDFHYSSNPVLPMASLDQHGNVIYIGTLSKTLAPAIRVGFMVAPVNFIEAVSNFRKSVDFQGDTMMEVAIAELYRNGTIARHVKKAVKTYQERRDHFCGLLKDKLGDKISFKIPDGGMSVWVTFNNTDLKQIVEKAAPKGLILNDASKYNKHFNYNASRFGFASLNFEEQERAVEILGGVV